MGWPLLYETPLGMICLYEKVMLSILLYVRVHFLLPFFIYCSEPRTFGILQDAAVRHVGRESQFGRPHGAAADRLTLEDLEFMQNLLLTLHQSENMRTNSRDAINTFGMIICCKTVLLYRVV